MSQWEKRTIFSDVFPTQKWQNVPILLCLYFLGGWYLFKFTPPHFFPKQNAHFFLFVSFSPPKKKRPSPAFRWEENLSVERNGTELEGRPPAPEVAKAGFPRNRGDGHPPNHPIKNVGFSHYFQQSILGVLGLFFGNSQSVWKHIFLGKL